MPAVADTRLKEPTSGKPKAGNAGPPRPLAHRP